MGIWEIVVGSVVLLLSVVMIIIIILQEGHDSGLGTITGGADSFMKRGKAKTADALFARITKYCAVIFFVFVVVLNMLSYFGWTGKPKTESTGTSIQSSEQASTDASADTSDEASTEASAQASTEASTEASAQASSEASAETSAQASSEASTQTSAAESSQG